MSASQIQPNMSNDPDVRQATPEEVRQAIDASNHERQRANAAVPGLDLPLHSDPEFHPVAADSPLTRLDDLVREERYAWHHVSEAIAIWLYHQHYDELPVSVRTRVEGSALRALRSPQGVWMAHSLRRAHLNLERAITQEMGPVFAMVAPEARQAMARSGVQAVVAALIGVLEVEQPFDGHGEALTVYEAADAAAKEVK